MSEGIHGMLYGTELQEHEHVHPSAASHAMSDIMQPCGEAWDQLCSALEARVMSGHVITNA